MNFFEQAENQLGELNLIAEDLGSPDDGVKKLLEESGFPGMNVLLFAFDGDKKNPYRPESVKENSVCYTGTHDNDTIIGYLKTLKESERAEFIKEIRNSMKELSVTVPLSGNESISRALITLCMACRSDYAIVPVQDILGLDNSARMNRPGEAGGNWTFRLKSMPEEKEFAFLKNLIKKYDRAMR